MAVEKFIRGKQDSCHHEGKRSEVRRLAESRNQLKEYMTHERYTLEQRLHVPFSHSIPSEPRSMGIGDNDGSDGFNHTNHLGEALIVPGVNCSVEEATQLANRGAVFPLETAEPLKGTFYDGNGDVWKPNRDLPLVSDAQDIVRFE